MVRISYTNNFIIFFYSISIYLTFYKSKSTNSCPIITKNRYYSILCWIGFPQLFAAIINSSNICSSRIKNKLYSTLFINKSIAFKYFI